MSPKINLNLSSATEMPSKWARLKRVWNLSIESHFCYYDVTDTSILRAIDKMITNIEGISLLPITK